MDIILHCLSTNLPDRLTKTNLQRKFGFSFFTFLPKVVSSLQRHSERFEDSSEILRRMSISEEEGAEFLSSKVKDLEERLVQEGHVKQTLAKQVDQYR